MYEPLQLTGREYLGLPSEGVPRQLTGWEYFALLPHGVPRQFTGREFLTPLREGVPFQETGCEYLGDPPTTAPLQFTGREVRAAPPPATDPRHDTGWEYLGAPEPPADLPATELAPEYLGLGDFMFLNLPAMEVLEYLGLDAALVGPGGSDRLPFFFPKNRNPSFSFFSFVDFSFALESVINWACAGAAIRNSRKKQDMMPRMRRTVFFQRLANIATFSTSQ